MLSRVRSRVTLPLVVAALFVAALSSCAGDDGDLLNLSQTWALQTVKDSTLPYTVPNATHDIVITSATVDLNPNNSYTTTFTGTVDGTPGTIGSDHGGWSVSSSEINFNSLVLHLDYVAGLTGHSFRASMPGTIIGSSDHDFSMVFGDQQ